MKCLCCGKELLVINKSMWHKECIKRFFGVSVMPDIDLSEENIEDYGKQIISDKKSITGVQKKLSLHLDKYSPNNRLTIIGYPLGYILKPETAEYEYIARAEHLVMQMAHVASIETSMNGLIILNDNNYAYITKRIDRNKNEKIHMEDFCQLSEKPTEYKYNGSYEKCAKIIDKYSSIPSLDKSELFYRLLFCFCTGNSDMHLKNFSLIEKDDKAFLSPAYDLLPVNILINDLDETALQMNGKNRNITKNDFLKFAKSIGLSEIIASKLIKKIVSYKDIFIELINDSLLSNELKELFKKLMLNRYKRFE